MQGAWRNFPNCVYGGYPSMYYGYGSLGGYYGSLAAWAPIQALFDNNAWNPSACQQYYGAFQQYNTALLEQARQAQLAFADRFNK